MCGNSVLWKGAPSTQLVSVATTKVVAGVLEANGIPGAVCAVCSGGSDTATITQYLQLEFSWFSLYYRIHSLCLNRDIQPGDDFKVEKYYYNLHLIEIVTRSIMYDKDSALYNIVLQVMPKVISP